MVVYNSTLDNELVDFLQVANSLLAKCGITFKIRSLDDFTADMFVLVFENVLHCKLQEKIDPPHSREDNIHNLQSVIDSLAIDILNIDLSHITGEAVVSGDRQALCNLLEIFAGVAEYLAIDQNVSQITNVSTDRVDVLHDPDIITGRGMNINYSSSATTPQQSSNNYLASTRTLDTVATLDTVNELMLAPKSELSVSVGASRKTKAASRRPREVNSAGGDANTKIASPDPERYSKVLSPISIHTPTFRLLLPEYGSNQLANLRHVPATWDLNEAGDTDTGGVASEGGATLGMKTLSGITASGDYLTEEPFSSAGGKSDSSSKCTVINPVMTTDDAESSDGYDRSSSAALLERSRERGLFVPDLSTTESRRVLAPGEKSGLDAVGSVELQSEANHRPNAKVAWLDNSSQRLAATNTSIDGAQVASNYDYGGRSFDTSKNNHHFAVETSSISDQTTTKNTSVQDSTFNFIPKPVTSINFVPKPQESQTQEHELDIRVFDDAGRDDVRKAKETLAQSKKEKSQGAGASVLGLEPSSTGDITVAEIGLQDTAKSLNETFTAGDESAITPRNTSNFNQDVSVQESNEVKSDKVDQNNKQLVDRPVSPIESIFEPASTSFQDASVQCTAKGLRNSGRSSNSSRNKYPKQMPNVFERLYPKKSQLPVAPLGKDQSFEENTPRSRVVDSNVSVSGLTLNSASILAENQNPPPLLLSSSAKIGHKKTGNQYLDGSNFSSDSKHDAFKLNLVDLSMSADTSNFSESYSHDKLIPKGKFSEGSLTHQKYPRPTTDLRSRGDSTLKSGLTGSTNASACERIETDEQYEAVRKRLLEKLQQFRVPESMHDNKKGERLQFGAVGEFKGTPVEMSGKWSHVREKLDQETEREKVNTDRLKQNLAKTFRQVKSAEEHKAFMHQIKLDKVHSDMKSLHKLTTTGHQQSPIKKRYSSGVIFTQRRGNNYLRGTRKSGPGSTRRSKSAKGLKRSSPKEDSVDGFETERSSSLGAADESNSPRGTSGRTKRTISQRAPEIGQNEMLSFLLDEFPQLKLSKEMTHVLWKKQLKQMHFLAASAAKENQALSGGGGGGVGRGKNGPMTSERRSNRELVEAEKRQGLLMDIMKKEVEHSIRMKERKEQRQRETVVKTNVREQKQASARVRRYYDEFQVRMKSRMAKKKSKEEQIFRQLFDEGLEIQKNRIAEIRKYCREKRQARTHQQQNEVESLENYYRDQFAILAEAVDKEKKEVELNDKAQALALEKMKNELRQKLESDIRLLQMQLVENDDAVYFRGLEAEKMREQLRSALFKTQF